MDTATPKRLRKAAYTRPAFLPAHDGSHGRGIQRPTSDETALLSRTSTLSLNYSRTN